MDKVFGFADRIFNLFLTTGPVLSFVLDVIAVKADE
jgi:hypothetical protein